MEWDPGWPLEKFLTHPPRVVDGLVRLPSGPGLGTDIREDFVAKHRVDHF